MIPIHELLNRIRWDEAFGDAEFEIGYYDRIEDRVIRTPMKDVYFEPDDHFSFHVIDESGEAFSVPLHRIRDVYRNGERIWHRAHGGR